MPATSKSQERLMQAAAHTKGGYGGVPQKVGKEFVGDLKQICDCLGKIVKAKMASDDIIHSKENGQFVANGGGAGTANSKPTAPTGGKKMQAMLGIASKLIEQNGGSAPTALQYHAAVKSAGIVMKPEQSVKYLKIQLKAMKDGPATTKPESKKDSAEYAKEKGFSSPAAQVEKLATSAGYPKEGNYNGIDYYKAKDGSKVTYKPDSDSWVTLKDGKITASDKGTASLEALLASLPAAKSVAGPATKPAAAPKPIQDPHSTATAKSYGTLIPKEKFSFTSKGVASETGLPAKVQKSIEVYRGNGYKEINNAMRWNDHFDANEHSAQTMAHILNLQMAFNAAPRTEKEVDVVRKIDAAALLSMARQAGLSSAKDIQPGTILEENAICSTSHGEMGWSGDVHLEIKVPKGAKAIDLSETINQYEKEMLLPPNTRFKVSEIKSNGNYGHHIVCEVVL